MQPRLQEILSGMEVHVDDYADHNDENYFLTTPFADEDLNVPAIAGQIFLPSVAR